MDSDKIDEAEIGYVHEVSLVEHAVEKDEDQGYIKKMESMIEKDVLYKELNGKIETLDAHVMMLDAQVSQTAKAVKKQEALVKGKAVESERHQVNAISVDDFGEVLEQGKPEEDAFLVESCMFIGSSREVNKEELEGFHKRVKRVPKDMYFEDAYHKYRLGNFFGESGETDKDIELLFNKVSRKPKRTLKKEQDPGKFLIPCSIHSHHLRNALCDTGSAVSIMAIDTAEPLRLKMEPSKDSFTFVDSSRVNSAGMIKNVKVEIGECIIPVDFHAMDIKSGKTSPLLFGRAFMATVGAGLFTDFYNRVAFNTRI
ncbi:PREDICTED: uncharacterized protein LOC106330605 [Brassica oleracea var. oleracea]|uniref:uncharacterized protein LOC106330605 n=1 Tax=Brassica oleracea var. oleracea TaxID=109376 RepID=UPI0006A75699|nr:PREDICTED: uncharacterized protein LOC106330605 [Brassica oleracea var. oleracea]